MHWLINRTKQNNESDHHEIQERKGSIKHLKLVPDGFRFESTKYITKTQKTESKDKPNLSKRIH